jgi:hypothetical protein
MNNGPLNAILIASMIHLTAVTTSGAGTRWSRLTPPAAGFSVEVPGEPEPSTEPDQYVYSSGLWLLSVRSQANAPTTRQLVERGERKALVKCLESVRDSMVDAATGMRRSSSSSGNLDGYPSLRFSLENELLEGTNLLVLTREQLYLVMTVGPKGTRNADAERFLRSFRLVKTESNATRQLEGGINLKLFDDSEAIQREIESVIARVK